MFDHHSTLEYRYIAVLAIGVVAAVAGYLPRLLEPFSTLSTALGR